MPAHHDSTDVIDFLVGLDPLTLCAVDRDGNTALHLACLDARHDTIAMLLQKYDAASVSKTNAHGKLPIDLLWDSNAVYDRESNEYVGSVFQLLRANPEMVMVNNLTVEQSDVEATRHGKRRALLFFFEPPPFLPWWGLSVLYIFAISFWATGVCFFYMLSIVLWHPFKDE